MFSSSNVDQICRDYGICINFFLQDRSYCKSCTAATEVSPDKYDHSVSTLGGD